MLDAAEAEYGGNSNENDSGSATIVSHSKSLKGTKNTSTTINLPKLS